jgi:hypothetical protein
MTMTKTEMWAEHNRIRDRLKEVVKDQTAEIADLRHFVEWVSDGGPPGDPVQRREEAQQARDLLDNLYGKNAVDQAVIDRGGKW